MLALHDVVVTVVGMVVITGLLAVGVMPHPSERIYRFMCVVAAVSLFILVVEHQ